ATVVLDEGLDHGGLLGAQRALDPVDDQHVVAGEQVGVDDVRLVEQQRAGDGGALILEPGLEVGGWLVAGVADDADVEAVAQPVEADVDVVDLAVAVVVDQVAGDLELLVGHAVGLTVAVAGRIAVAVAVAGRVTVAVAVAVAVAGRVAIAVAVAGRIAIAIAVAIAGRIAIAIAGRIAVAIAGRVTVAIA